MELIQNAEFWVLVALVILVAVLIAAKVPAAAGKALDAHGARIQAELDEAKRLREEAQALLASIKDQRIQAEALAKDMLETAKADAARLEVEAKAKLDEQIKRRADLAERRIANAEAQATAEVKAAAVDLAAQIAESVLTARIARATSDPMVDMALSQLPEKLN